MASLTEQTADPTRARYKVRWREADGRARSESFRTERAAKRRLREIEQTVEAGTYVDDRLGWMTVEDWSARAAESWVDLSTQTRGQYARVLDTYILPDLGSRRLGDVTPDEIQRFVSALDRTLAAGSVRKIYYVVRRLFADAVRARRLAVSPCEGIRLPKASSKVPQTLTRVEVDKLAQALDDDYRAFAYVCGSAGLRIGEALALRWSDVDLDGPRPTITVRVGLVEVPGGHLTETTPKTRSGIRAIPLAQVAADALRDLRSWTDPAPRALVFPGPGGGFYRPNNFRRRVFDPAAEACGFSITPHALRHSALTSWLEAGATPMLAAAWAGHADGGALIVRTYGHVRAAHADQVLDALNE